MSKIVIIGGGAAGLVSAIYAAKDNNEVVIVERNEACGKKILATGNGKCNYFNKNQNLNHYYSDNIDIVKDIITKENLKEVLNLFDTLGIVPKIKNGYYYPNSNQASSVKAALILEAKLLGVNFEHNFLVTKIIKDTNNFIIMSANKKIKADKIILASGSKAAPKTGSDGNGYLLANSLNHTVIKPLPSLVQLRGNENYFKEWMGIRTDIKIKLLEDGKEIKEEQGEIQLTDYGISGICVFNLSGIIAKGLDKNKKEEVIINFVPWLNSNNELIRYLNQRNEKVSARTIHQLLEGMLNYKLISVLLEIANINKKTTWEKLTNTEKLQVAKTIREFTLNITKTNSFDNAQVCSGGIPLTEINPLTMESNKIKNLYFAGEILDVNGDCGGYNLTFAWISGMLAGKGVK